MSAFWHSHALAYEIALVLLIKLVVIFCIKAAFFSTPVNKKDAHQGVEKLWILESEADLFNEVGQDSPLPQSSRSPRNG